MSVRNIFSPYVGTEGGGTSTLVAFELVWILDLRAVGRGPATLRPRPFISMGLPCVRQAAQGCGGASQRDVGDASVFGVSELGWKMGWGCVWGVAL